MTPVIRCHDSELLSWSLERTDFSFAYADVVPVTERFPAELKEIAAAEKKVVIDLVVTSAKLLSELIGEQVNPGTTALYRGIDLVVVLPSLLRTQEALFLDAQAVLVRQAAGQDIRENLHALVRMHREPRAGGDPILVDDPERPEAHVVRVVVVGEREAVV